MSSISRRHAIAVLLVGGAMLFAACNHDLSEPPPYLRADSPVEEVWFRDVLQFLGRMHEALEEPSARVEFRLHLLAGREEWGLKRLGISSGDLAALFARMELMRPELEARWPELRDGGGEDLEFREELIEILRDADWPSAPDASSKLPEYVCAALEFFENASRCGSSVPWLQAVCMYNAYLRYLQHLSIGC